MQRISELIKCLEEAQKKYGDTYVFIDAYNSSDTDYIRPSGIGSIDINQKKLEDDEGYVASEHSDCVSGVIISTVWVGRE